MKDHFADLADMKPKPEHGKLSAYYNRDNGSGKIRGLYIRDNDEVGPIFEASVEPLRTSAARR